MESRIISDERTPLLERSSRRQAAANRSTSRLTRELSGEDSLLFCARQFQAAILNVPEELSQKQIGLLDKIIQKLETALKNVRSQRPDFKVDKDLYDLCDKYAKLKQEANETYQEKLRDYDNGVEKLTRDIQAIDEAMQQADSEAVIASLRKLESYKAVHDQIMENLNKQQTVVHSAGCCFTLFSCCAPSDLVRLEAEEQQLVRERGHLTLNNQDMLRDRLIDQFKQTRMQKQQQLDELHQHRPIEDDQFKREYIRAQARINHAKYKHNHQLDSAAMLECLRLYMFVQGVRPINLSAINTIVEKLKSELEAFYCLEPGEFGLKDYVARSNGLNEQARIALIDGAASRELLSQLFPSDQFSTGIKLR